MDTLALLAREADSTMAGNATAAQDLYGLGVRVGIYLQVVGMSLAIVRLKASSIKLACAGQMLAILGCWSVLVADRSISPAEALAIILISNVLLWPALGALICPTSIVGEGIGVFATYIATLWTSLAILAFWATIYRELPLLGTANRAFFFANVRLDGWFRIVSLVLAVFNLISVICMAAPTVTLLKKAVRAKAKRAMEDQDTSEALSYLSRGFAVGSIFMFPFMVAGTEMTIKYNNLMPTTDLSQPGQAIPLVIGVITLVDGFFAVWSEEEK